MSVIHCGFSRSDIDPLLPLDPVVLVIGSQRQTCWTGDWQWDPNKIGVALHPRCDAWWSSGQCRER